MNTEIFDILFNLVKEDLKEDLTKHSNRPPISAKFRLFITLVYLAHDDSTRYLSVSFKMGASTVRKIISETYTVLWDSLVTIYFSIPNNHEWQRIADDYEQIWNLPHCVGAIDGKHMKITCPNNSGATFYDYKGSHSIVLLAVCDANYNCTAVDIGAYVSQSDGGVLWHSNFGKQLFTDSLNLPKSCC